MTMGKYILDGHTPVEEHDLFAWAEWFETADRRVALTEAEGITVSTVFLGTDHNFSLRGDPVLFETMIFAEGLEGLDEWEQRYRTWDEAERGHEAACQAVNAYLQSRIGTGTR